MSKRPRRNPLEGLEQPSSELRRSELDLFVPPKGLDPILSYQEVEFTPIGSLDNFGPIIFTIPASTEFTDLSGARLSVKLKVQTSDGKNLEKLPEADGTDPDISVPNDLFDCLFRRIGLEVNATRTGSDHFHHPQLAILKNVLSYPTAVAEPNLKNALIWVPDSGDDARSRRTLERYKFIAESKEIILVSRLSHDVFNSRRLLPPGHSLKIRLDRASPEFCLIRAEKSKKEYKVKFEDLRLSITRVRVSQGMVRETEMHYKNGSPVYMPFTRTDARSFEIPSGTMYYKAQSLFSGVLPERAILVFCEPDSLGTGNYSNNPGIFPAKKFAIHQVQFFIDEREVLNHPYEPDWKNKQYQNEYQGLLRVTRLDQSLVGSEMQYSDFARDYGIFAVTLRGFDGKEVGNLSVSVRFTKATSQPISGLLIPEFRSCLMIDSDGNVCQSDY